MDTASLATVLIILAGGGAALALSLRYTRALDAAWQRAADELGLEYARSFDGGRTIHGSVEGCPVAVDTEVVGSGKNRQVFTRIRLEGRGAIPLRLQLKPESTWEGVKKAFGLDDLQLDEARFDDAVNVAGPEDLTLSALDARARRAVLRLVGLRGEIREGNAFFRTRGVLRQTAQIVAVVRAMALCAGALRVESVPKSLLRNAHADPVSGVRRRNLEVLVRHHPQAPETQEALQRGLEDRAAEVKLFAAATLREGPRVREAMDALLDDPALPEKQRVEALTVLLESAPYPSVSGRVAWALGDPSLPLRAVAVAAAGRAKDAPMLLSRRVLASTRDAGLGVALAQALGEACGAQGEPMLLQLLGSEASEVKLAAARVLGRCGTARAVEPLLPLTGGLLADGALKQAAREAVRAIQARLGDADAGGLSVVEGRESDGGLSLRSGLDEERAKGRG